MTLIPEARIPMRQFLSWAIPYVEENYKLTLKGISGSRTAAEQDALYAQGRTAPGKIVTNARAGQSNHNYGLALDLGIFDGAGEYVDSYHSSQSTKIYREIAMRCDEFGLTWGGNWRSFPDAPHFQYGDLSTEEMAKLYPIYVG